MASKSRRGGNKFPPLLLFLVTVSFSIILYDVSLHFPISEQKYENYECTKAIKETTKRCQTSIWILDKIERKLSNYIKYARNLKHPLKLLS